jgi:hypothetical protein
MRLITAASATFVLALGVTISVTAETDQTVQTDQAAATSSPSHEGREIFRFDTFGDEQLWTDVLRMHEVLPAVSPRTALSVGLKVDAEALPGPVLRAIRAKTVDLDDPAVTNELIRLNAVVGVKGSENEQVVLTKGGITCAISHSSVDN